MLFWFLVKVVNLIGICDLNVCLLVQKFVVFGLHCFCLLTGESAVYKKICFEVANLIEACYLNKRILGKKEVKRKCKSGGV